MHLGSRGLARVDLNFFFSSGSGIKIHSTVFKPPTEEVCLFSPDTGSCEQSMYRYYYSFREGRCLLFGYTGCGGNANNFIGLEECERTCGHLKRESSVLACVID